jgi:EAL domain-containing protein (putative c-di-GMP-specific phosphodiesterase class I)
MTVIAEGVETPAQLERLRAMQCSHAQGFWFSEPVDRMRAEQLLRSSKSW